MVVTWQFISANKLTYLLFILKLISNLEFQIKAKEKVKGISQSMILTEVNTGTNTWESAKKEFQ